MNSKTLIVVLCGIIALSLIVSAVVFIVGGETPNVNLTVVGTPQQSAPEWPDAIPDPMANMVTLPDTENLAYRRPVTATSFADVYIASNAVDGYVTSYWESNGFPADFTIQLDGSQTFSTIALRLNPSTLWEARAQTFEVLTSTDGTNFTTLIPSAVHEFDPLTGNAVRLDFDAVSATHVRFTFTATTALRTSGAQIAQFLIFQ